MGCTGSKSAPSVSPNTPSDASTEARLGSSRSSASQASQIHVGERSSCNVAEASAHSEPVPSTNSTSGAGRASGSAAGGGTADRSAERRMSSGAGAGAGAGGGPQRRPSYHENVKLTDAYQLGKVLGKGGFGEVRAGARRGDSKRCVGAMPLEKSWTITTRCRVGKPCSFPGCSSPALRAANSVYRCLLPPCCSHPPRAAWPSKSFPRSSSPAQRTAAT